MFKEPKLGSAVQITNGAFAGVRGKVICAERIDSLSGLVLAPNADRDKAIPIEAEIDGERVKLGGVVGVSGPRLNACIPAPAVRM
jgi:hypothetical protein